WFMLHRIRHAMKELNSGIKFGGPESGGVEVDESYVGGKVKNMHKRRRLKLTQIKNEIPAWKATDRYPGKTAVMGMFDRESRKVRAKVVPNVKRETLQNEILANINMVLRSTPIKPL